MKKLPEEFEFPGGYVVGTRLRDPGTETWAEWDDETRTISIDRTVPLAVKRWLYLHELEHAFADWRGWVADHFPVKAPSEPEPDSESEEIENEVSP